MTRGFLLRAWFAVRAVMLAAAIAVVLATSAGAQQAPQLPPAGMAFLDHVKNARLLAAGDLAGRNLTDCSMPPHTAAPPAAPLLAPPTTVLHPLSPFGTNTPPPRPPL